MHMTDPIPELFDLSRRELRQKVQDQMDTIIRLSGQVVLMTGVLTCPRCDQLKLRGRGHGIVCEACGWQLGVEP